MQPINIHSEVRKLITDYVDRGEVQDVQFYVNTIMARHTAIEGADTDFYVICTRQRIKEVVTATISRFNPKKQPVEQQLVLDGFEYLQVAYTFERGGKTMLVPLDQCTDIELAARAREYDDMANGCRAHAREIREYLNTRSQGAA